MNIELVKRLRWMIPLLLLIWLEWFKRQPALVEKYYSQSIYPGIGSTLRQLLGKLSFSVGDLLVAFLIGWVLYKSIQFLLQKKPGKWLGLLKAEKWGSAIRLLIYVYILFHVFWGMNYYRLGSAHLLQLETESYTNAEADTLVAVLQSRLLTICSDTNAISEGKTGERKQLGEEAMRSYKVASTQYPFMAFEHQSLKPILLGKLQAYAGYGGYIFPFTGEAHADFFVPNFTLPFTVCHEMAHQLGFGTESEANLVGFLAARESKNAAFKYSAYAGVHQYAIAELYGRDSLLARGYIDSLPAYYRSDRKLQRQFIMEHQSFLQPMLDATYTLYLQGNNQPQGLESYNKVVAWLIAYGKKYGWEKL
jgi:hypothetical protein